MNERTAQILEAAIQEHIQTNAPVSSGALYDRYEFGIKPAMIRIELDALEEAGYLQKPHYSAGRIPTNMGYEFFARRMLEQKTQEKKSVANDDLKKLFDERALPDFLNELSEQLGLLSVAANSAAEQVYKSGLERLIDNLDWEDQAGIRSVIHDFANVDARLSRAAEKMGDGPHIFIGNKSPVTKSENLSVVCGNYKLDDDVIISVFAIGPKRMDYRKVIRIFKSL